MKKVLLLATLLVISGTANAISLTLLAHNQRSSSGTLSTLKWSGCTTYNSTTPCINPGNATLAGMGITPSTAAWDWDSVTGVLSMAGTFNTASTISSSGTAAASVVIGDKVVDMVIDTVNDTTTAASYICAEGNFLGNVGANGCLNLDLDGLDDTGDGLLNSSVVYNVGGAANCIQRTIGGDDASTGNPRGLASAAAAGICDAVDGAFNLWTIVSDTTASGGTLVISNGIDTSLAGTSYMTFQAEAIPLPAAAWLLAPAVLAAGRFSRRRKAA